MSIEVRQAIEEQRFREHEAWRLHELTTTHVERTRVVGTEAILLSTMGVAPLAEGYRAPQYVPEVSVGAETATEIIPLNPPTSRERLMGRAAATAADVRLDGYAAEHEPLAA